MRLPREISNRTASSGLAKLISSSPPDVRLGVGSPKLHPANCQILDRLTLETFDVRDLVWDAAEPLPFRLPRAAVFAQPPVLPSTLLRIRQVDSPRGTPLPPPAE